MALPDNFSPTEQFQDTIRRAFNPIVRRYFRDVGPEDWDETLQDDRSHLRVACTHRENDSLALTQARMDLFRDLSGLDLREVLLLSRYDLDVEEDDELIENRPQVQLFFAQDSSAAPDGRSVIKAEVSFRLMNFLKERRDNMEGQLFEEADARTLARDIRAQMMNGYKPYTFTKGKFLYTYTHKKLGYRFRLFVGTEAEAIKTIKRVLDIRNHPYEERRLTLCNPVRRNSENNPPGTRRIYGKNRKQARWRPIANVKFRWAMAEVGLNRKVVLIDATGHFPDALIKA